MFGGGCFLYGVVCLAQSAPAGSARLDGCADAGEARTRGLRVTPGASAERAESALLSFRVFSQIRDSNGWGPERLTCPGARLASGDRIRISVHVNQPLYLYVLSMRPDRSMTVLYPPSGSPVLASPGTEVTLPGTGQTFELDDETGNDEFRVIGSAKPLPSVDAKLATVVAQVNRSERATAPGAAAAPSKARRPREAGAGAKQEGQRVALLGTRGLVVKRDDSAIEALAADPMGVVVAPFWFRHAAR